jgi:hypothetical protein
MTPTKFIVSRWHDLGIISAVIAGAYLAIGWGDLGVLQRLLLLNFIVVLLHQFEEYSWPGGFPAIANHVMLSIGFFGRYFKPLDQFSSMGANLAFAYVFYLLPVFFPQVIWLGLGPILVGAVLQVIEHAFLVNYMLRSPYSPGMATAVLGFLPVGVVYIYYIQVNGLATGWDWVAGVGYLVVGVTIVFYVIEQLMLGSDNPKYPFTEEELGRFHVTEKLAAAQRIRSEKKQKSLPLGPSADSRG